MHITWPLPAAPEGLVRPPSAAALAARRAAHRLCAWAFALACTAAALSMPTAASAQSSSYLRQCKITTQPGKLVFNVPGTLSIDPSLPKGSVVGTYYANPTGGGHFAWECGDSGTDLPDLMDLQVLLHASKNGPNDDVLRIPNTNLGIKLVGTRFAGPYSGGALFAGGRHFEQATMKRNSTASRQLYKGEPLAMQIIALGSVKSGETIAGGPIGSVQATRVEDIDHPGTALKFFDIELDNTITITAEACTVEDTTVNLGRHELVGGVGATTPLVDFTVAIRGCPTYVNIYYRVDPDTSVVSPVGGAGGLIALDSTSSATGAAIQLLDMNGNPHPFGTNILHVSGASVPNSHLWLSARYMQTAARVTPGTANASASVTITYD